MKATLLLLGMTALLIFAPVVGPAAATPECDAKLVKYEKCPWPGGVGEFCVRHEEVRVCFGPI